MVSHFKQLCNKYQGKAVYVLPLAPDCDCPLYPTSNCFRSQQHHLPHTLLTRGVRARPGGLLVRFSAGLFVAFQLAIGWYHPGEIERRLWQGVCDLLPLGAFNRTEQDGMVL